jgi:hypothetical protein
MKEIELGLVKRVVIGYQDRFVRFGYDWFEQFCEQHGTEITVINGETFSPEELVRDLKPVKICGKQRVTKLDTQVPGRGRACSYLTSPRSVRRIASRSLGVPKHAPAADRSRPLLC